MKSQAQNFRETRARTHTLIIPLVYWWCIIVPTLQVGNTLFDLGQL